MKNFIIFFSIVLLVYASVNYYIFIRGWQVLPKDSAIKYYYLGIFLFLALSFFAGRILENYYLSVFSNIFVWLGAYWLAFMVYFLLSIIFIDLLRFANYLTGFFPDFVYSNYEKTKQITAIIVVLVSTILVIAGRINALNPRLYSMDLHIPKKAGNEKSLKIAMASDIHLGTLIGNSRLEKLVIKLNESNPDLILLPGDIVDEDLKPVIKENLGETLRQLKAKYGVYAITGNHEYIGGAEEASKYLTEHGIVMLRDSVVKINNSIYLIGREDRAISQFSDNKRIPLNKLMIDVDKNFPVILMDHQPFHLEEAILNGVDLQLSGHTHHGQLWPFNYITELVYEVSWGYKKKDNTHFYISSGFGGWGPPIRLGNRSEIIYLTLNFD